MALRMLGQDPNSPDGNSPTVYLDADADSEVEKDGSGPDV
jgi:hypothetical protein